MRFCLVLFAGLLLAACKPAAPAGPTEPAPHPLLGGWKNIDMRVEFAADSVMDVPPGQWEAKLRIRPILTTFRADSTMVSEYRNLADSLVMNRPGQWYTVGDTVFLFYNDVQAWESYHFQLSGDTVRFTGASRFDSDSLPDLYTGRQVRVAQ